MMYTFIANICTMKTGTMNEKGKKEIFKNDNANR